MRSEFLVEKTFTGLSSYRLTRRYGKVTQVHGYFIEATYIDSKVGEVAKIFNNDKELECEVVSISEESALLAPLEMPIGVGVGNKVIYTDAFAEANLLQDPFSKIINGLGQDVAQQSHSVIGSGTLSLHVEPVPVSWRASVNTMTPTSIKLIDYLLPLGRGQKMGVFSGSGVGKSTLLNKLQKEIQADVKIIAMIGERSREVVEFYEAYMDAGNNRDTFIVASTSDESPMMKCRALKVALSYSKVFCDQGKQVLLIVDSMTRFAHALREVAISRGELPIARGYPTSVFNELSKVVEMCGNFQSGGSITGLMSILVDGDDEHDPISDYMRGILDGHLLLDRRLSDRGLYPAIDILKSRSRVSDRVLNDKDQEIARKIKHIYSRYADVEDVIKTGIYVPGSNPDIDSTIKVKTLLDSELYSSGKTLSTATIHEVLQYTKNHQA
ncbi:FliI/YscN family ATPase [Vibrio coralliilyticus]|uniref:protein-secreting ATPase n=1 Tax=Vibrio coralliilyticus TaxID=190893 RepID=A0AAP7DDU4_9VIBR|nr:FliI/YscN family ATPase [Vibrio coralliilyticus]NOJ23561.1 FliI/YscN family ATPase [Vibrio coralliilyticus]